MTQQAATKLTAIARECGLTAIVMHHQQWGDSVNFVELPVPAAWEVADWQRKQADAAMLRAGLAA